MQLNYNQPFLLAYRELWASFAKAMNGLKLSVEHCNNITIKDHYSFEETEAFDALIIKLSRNSDLFFQQIIKGYFKLKGEELYTLIDRLNLLEKMGVWEDSSLLMQLKSFRNQSVHEYADVEFESLYAEAVEFSVSFIHYTEKFFVHLKKENLL
jgi:hypothetical protein